MKNKKHYMSLQSYSIWWPYEGNCSVCFESKELYNYYSCILKPEFRMMDSHHGLCQSCYVSCIVNNPTCPICREPEGSIRYK